MDATAGNGNDTEFLCRICGENGRVYAFDIQAEAIANTEERLKRCGLEKRAVLIRDGHERMGEYVKESVSAIVFNFGYLPGMDHSIATKPNTSVRAIEEGLKLLRPDGVMSLCIYSGRDSGYEERDAILSYLMELDMKLSLIHISEPTRH